jgi:periplasmic protein TonB
MQSGFLDTNSRRPAVMAAVVIIHTVGIGALIPFAPTVTKTAEKILAGRLIPVDPAPPVVMLDPAPKTKASTTTRIDPLRRIVDRPVQGPEVTLAHDNGPLVAAGTGEGIGGGMDIIDIDPPKPPVIVGPRFVGGNAQPPYPPGLQRLNIEGVVTVRVLVGIDGRPLRIEAVKVDQDAFFAATRDWALKHWRFAPATRDGEPFQEWRTMTVRFEMN